MRGYLTYLFVLISFVISAQKSTNTKISTTKKRSVTTTRVQAPKVCLEAFYETHCLHPDSAYSPYLYYQVYDWLGTRYKYSGNSKNGIDCSGFVGEIYKNTYCVDLGRSSGNIWSQVKPVNKEELKEGDLLFFKIRKNQISHVGLYLGNNKFAHASIHEGVTVSDLDDTYYKKYFYKGGRLANE